MDENPRSRFGRTIWTVWGYLSGTVARYLRPEVTDEGKQNASSKSDDADLKSTANKAGEELKSNNGENEENKQNEIDKCTVNIKCSLSEVKTQVASVQWENTDVVKDDSNSEFNAEIKKKQTYSFAVWSTETDNGGSTSGDTEIDGHKDSVHAEPEKLNVGRECRETAHELEETVQIEQDDAKNEEKKESDNHEDEKCALKEEDSGNANVMQTELHEQDKVQESEWFGDFKDANEYFFEDKKKTKRDDDQGTKCQLQVLLPQQEYSTEEADSFSKPEWLNLVEKCSDVAEFFKNESEEMVFTIEEDKEGKTKQELEEAGQIEQKDGKFQDEECGQDHEDEKREINKEDQDNLDIMVQSELYGHNVEQEKQMSLTDLGETEAIAGFKHADECFIDEKEKNVVDQKDEDQEPESQMQDLLPHQEYITEEVDELSSIKVMETYSDGIAEFSKNEVEAILTAEPHKENETEEESEETGEPEQKDDNSEEKEECDGNCEDEMIIVEKLREIEKYSDEIAESLKSCSDVMLTPRQDEDIIESKQSVKTLQRVSELTENEMELQLTKIVDEVSYSKQDTPETGTGSPVVTIKTDHLFSDKVVSEFPGELRKVTETALDLGHFKETNLHELQTFGEQHIEREIVTHSVEHSIETSKALEEAVQLKQDIETQIKPLGATESEMFIECAELTTEMIDETMETKISLEDKEAKLHKTESGLSITNVTVQQLEFTEGPCKTSQRTMDTFSELAKHVVEGQTDAKPVLRRSLSPEEFLEESGFTLQCESKRCFEKQEILETDVVKIALKLVEEITKQALKEIIETEINLQETEASVGPLTEKGSISGDTDNEGHKDVEKEMLQSDEGQAEILYANSEFKESGTAQELEKAGQTEEKNEESDQNLEDEKCAVKREDSDIADVMIQSEEKEINIADLEEKKRPVDECLKTIVDQKDEEKTENDEIQNPELQAPTDTSVLEEQKSEERQLLSEQVESNVEMEVEIEPVKESEPVICSPEFGWNKLSVMFSTEADNVVSISGDTENEGHKDVEKETLQSDEGQAEILYANSECKESGTAQELEKAGQTEEKNEESDQNLEDEQCAVKREDSDIAYVMIQSEEKEINITDHGEKKEQVDECLKTIVDQKDEEKTENDEEQNPELQAPTDTSVLEEIKPEERQLLSEQVESNVEMEVEIKPVKESEPVICSPEFGWNKQSVMFSTETDNVGSISGDTDNEGHKDVEKEMLQSDEGWAERLYANSEFKDSGTAKEWEEAGQTEENDEESDQNLEDEKCAVKREDSDIADVMIQSEEKEINIADLDEKKGPVDECLKTIVDQKDEEKTENDEIQNPELQAPTDTSVLEEQKSEERQLLSEQVESNVEMEVEIEPVKESEPIICLPEFGWNKQSVMLSTETDNVGSISGDTENEGHKDVEKETLQSDECQAERLYANSECKESGTAQELEEAGQTEEKNEESDQNLEDEKCAVKREDSDIAYVMIQCEEKEINIADLDEKKGPVDECLKTIVDQKDEEKTENYEEQDPELQAPTDTSVLEEQKSEERQLISEQVESNVEMEVEIKPVKESEPVICSPEFGWNKQSVMFSTETDNVGSISGDTENEGHKDSGTVQELEKAGQTEENNEESDQNPEDEKCAVKREDSDITDLMIQSEEKEINITHHGEKKGQVDELLKTNVDQKDVEKNENDEGQNPELQAPTDTSVQKPKEMQLLSEPVESKVEMEVETIRSEVKQNISSPECDTTDRPPEQIKKVMGGIKVLNTHEELMEVSKTVMKRGFDQVSKDRPHGKTQVKFAVHQQAFTESSLDFTIQKSRIAVKNPLVRPPKDPRRLLAKVSVEPLPPKPLPCTPRVPVCVPSKGVIGFKLPGLGAGMPVLRKTEFGKKAREEEKTESTLQPQQTSVAVTEDSIKQEQASAKPKKWTPPRHPGMGGPLMMAELKNKLKKPVNE